MIATIAKLTLASVWHRRKTLSLVVLTLALSVSLLLGVQYLRTEVKKSFVNTISGTDLIVGARSGPLNLLLYSVFHIGDATNNIRWTTYQRIESDPAVDWAIPVSLGDSHRGYRVVGTRADFFSRFMYGSNQSLQVSEGRIFSGVYEAVVGADVAKELGYREGDSIILAHGTGSVSFVNHKDKPFTVVGTLARTGTPVDKAVYVSLRAIEAIHVGWQSGVPVPGRTPNAEDTLKLDLTPHDITAVMVGIKRKVMTFQLQRKLNQLADEPLSAILPGVALSQLWRIMGGFEKTLLIITGFVVVTSLIGMLAVLLTAQAQRSREMAILRANGATPLAIAALFGLEAIVISIVSVALALGFGYTGIAFVVPMLEGSLGVHLGLRPLSVDEIKLLAAVPLMACVISLVPAFGAYRKTLAEGLTPKE
ncbi:ABC transporter permease [Marinobacter sp. BGYM27]|uniref:ABC transporter permease n=1 Tax=Marinobacter sp. BGYM27 TaxID=2975597 RepID=UPI0021A5C242|nr:ABC transporter permease [Marinobacter sp. BGYM27]MDG5500249.1 ABC transporter permease [Marinobacter sp. BGYM27]